MVHILVGGFEHVLFFHILGITSPTNFHIFQRGRSITNQYIIYVPMIHFTGLSGLSLPNPGSNELMFRVHTVQAGASYVALVHPLEVVRYIPIYPP